MELSTNIPTPKDKPKRVITLSVKFEKRIKTNVAITEIGMDIVTIMIWRKFGFDKTRTSNPKNITYKLISFANIVPTINAKTTSTAIFLSRNKNKKNTKKIKASDLVEKLASAGLETKDLGAASIHMDDLSRFPEEPRSTLYLKVSDGKGNATPMTFVEFGSWKVAAKVDEKPINGFAVRNWFVLGIVNNYFVERVHDALDT